MTGGTKPGSKAGWRKSTRAAVAPIGHGREFGVQGASRRSLVFRVSAMCCFAIALGIFLILQLLKRPDRDVPFVTVAVTQSAGRIAGDPLPVPPNAFAFEDVSLLHLQFGNPGDQHLHFLGNPEGQTGSLESDDHDPVGRMLRKLTQPIANATGGGPDGKMMAFFITAQGLVDQETPYLMLGDSQPDDQRSWVKVEELLDGLDRFFEAKSDQLKDCRAVIFLDASRGSPAWDWGKVDNSFTDACRRIFSNSRLDRFALVLAAETGERSWCNLRGGQSLFCDAIISAMGTDADADRDGTITVGEIASLIRSEVASDAQRIWAASQHPVMITEAAVDWKFIRAPSSFTKRQRPESGLEPVNLASRFAQIENLWNEHNALANRSHAPLHTRPEAWAMLEKYLAHIDKTILAGPNYDFECEALIGECEALLAELKDRSRMMPAKNQLSDIELTTYFSYSIDSLPANPEFQAAWTKAWEEQKGFDPQAYQVPESLQNEDSVVSFLWPWLVEEKFSDDSLQAASAMLRSVSLDPQSLPAPQYLETFLIHLFTAEDLQQIDDSKRAVIAEHHNLSRNANLADDIRATFWGRQTANDVDRARMRAIDRLFSIQERSDSELSELVTSYAKLKQRHQQIADLYNARDQILHEGPRIAETLLADPAAFRDTVDPSRVVTLLGETTAAGRELSEYLNAIDEDAGAPLATTQSLEQLRAILRDRVAATTGEKAGDERALRQTVALLHGTGVNNASDRQKLHGQIIALLDKDPTDTAELLAITKETRASTGESVGLNLMQLLVSNPNLAIRDEIGSLRQSNFGDYRARSLERSRGGKGLREVRAEIDQLEASIRQRSILLTNLPSSIERLIRDRFEMDLSLFMLAETELTLNDFWCQSSPSKTENLVEPPFFKQAAARLLLGNTFFEQPILAGVDLNQRLLTSAELQADSNVLRPIPESEFRQPVLVEDVIDKTVVFDLQTPTSLPTGMASVFHANDQRLVELGDAPQKSYDVRVNQISDNESSIAVNVFFRGIRRDGHVSVRSKGDPNIVLYKRPGYSPPKMVVRSTDRAAENVVLVLDCSGSMNNRLESGNKRMNTAIETIELLLQMMPDDQMSMGLVFFGHRYNWATEKRNGRDLLVLKDGNFGEVIEKNSSQSKRLNINDLAVAHNPNFDVEQVVDITPLTIENKARIRRLLGDTEGFGITPTYQAISEAYAMLGNRRGRIIVLTDGAPMLAGETPVKTKAEQFKRAAQKTFEASRAKVPLHIINFANSADQTELKNVFPGTVTDANDDKKLLSLLEQIVLPVKSSWRTKKENELASRSVSGGDIASIDDAHWPAAGEPLSPVREFIIEAANIARGGAIKTTVAVEGGEFFELVHREGKLEHQPLDVAQLRPLKRIEGPSAFDVWAYPPRRTENRELTLKLAVNNVSVGDFTPRPIDIWVELSPIANNEAEIAPYTINLAEFEQGKAYPTLVCRIPQWPRGADTVKVNAWLNFGTAAEAVPLERYQDSGGDNLVLSSDAMFMIKEQLARPMDRVRRRLTITPLPDEVESRIYPAGDRRIEHIFRYSRTPTTNVQVFVTDREQIIDRPTTLHVSGEIIIPTR